MKYKETFVGSKTSQRKNGGLNLGNHQSLRLPLRRPRFLEPLLFTVLVLSAGEADGVNSLSQRDSRKA